MGSLPREVGLRHGTPVPARPVREVNRSGTARELRLEFRIPISPRAEFYHQVGLFDFALRRLGAPYDQALLTVVVGDEPDPEALRTATQGTAGSRVRWIPVPSAISREFGIHGTADFRWEIDPGDADVIVMSDADTVLLREISPALALVGGPDPIIAGHMAHLPPPASAPWLPDSREPDFWPRLLAGFSAPDPTSWHRYSLDRLGVLPLAPPYFNLGFLAASPTAVTLLGREMLPFQREFNSRASSHMRCQIACTLLSLRHGIRLVPLPAEYNAANDLAHLESNHLAVESVRVLHYLRTDEIDRYRILHPEFRAGFLSRTLSNPTNRLLQDLVRCWDEHLGARGESSPA